MKCYKQIGASAALLTGLASGLSISTLNPSTAHAAELDKIDTSTWGKPTTTQSKTVTYVDSTGKILGTGTLTVNTWKGADDRYQYVLDRTIPAGYKLLDNSSLGNFPDTLTVVTDPSSSVPSSAHFGKKIEQLATSDPSNSSSTQNGGDGNGKSDVADAGHGASGSDTGQPHESGSITNGNDNASGKSGAADAGHGASGSGTGQSHESGFITNGKASSKVESNGKGSANASGTSNVASKPELAVIKAKPVLYVDENGKKLGIGQISVKSDGTREIYAVNKTIPAGYALQNTSDLKNYPDKLTLVKSAASTDTSDASVVSYARTADGKIADVTSTTGDGASPTSDGKATDGTGAGGGDDVESGDADAGKDAKNGGTASITSTDAGKDAESKTVAPATTTTTTSTGSTEGNTSSSLPQTGNSGEETSSAVGAALLMATMTVAGIARKKL